MGFATHQPWSRISAAFCVQPVCTTVSACIPRHTVGTHSPAACFSGTANTTAFMHCSQQTLFDPQSSLLPVLQSQTCTHRDSAFAVDWSALYMTSVCIASPASSLACNRGRIITEQTENGKRKVKWNSTICCEEYLLAVLIIMETFMIYSDTAVSLSIEYKYKLLVVGFLSQQLRAAQL